MGQTPAGAIKARQSMIERYGSEEAYKAHLRSIGSKGGKVPSTGGFAGDRALARRAGAIGGRISRRRPREDS